MTPRPPWVPRWLARLVPDAHREEWLGDLIEEADARSRAGRGRVVATLALWLGIVRSVAEARVEERRLGRMDERGRDTMGFGIGQDLRVGSRMLRREPAAAGAAFGTLALGVWAFLTGFAFVDAALLDPLGYPGENRLVVVGKSEGALFGVSMPDHVELVEGSDLFEDAAAWQGWGMLLRPEDGPWTTVPAASVTSGYLDMLGAEPALGRLFGPGDDVAGHEPAVVLSHAAWTARFGGRRDVLGDVLEHEGVSYTVVGVVADGFRDPLPRLFGWSQPEVWRASPPVFQSSRADRGQVSFWSLARLRPGIPAREADAVVRARSGESLGVSAAEVAISVRPYSELVARRSRASLLLLLGAGVSVLMVSVANLVNLLLARSMERTQEMAVRSALGAGRGRLVRQLLVEGALLGVVAAVAGGVLTRITLPTVARLSASLLPADADVGVSATVALVAVVVSVAAALAAALIPALGATRSVHLATLRQGRRGSGRRTGLQTGLIVSQTAIAVVLVTGAGLLLRTVRALGDVELGFDAGSVTASWLALHGEMFGDDAEQSATLRRVVERLRGVAGVERAAAITDLPMSGRVNSTSVRRTDVAAGGALELLQTLVRAVEPGYLDVMGIPLLEGRALTVEDRRGTPQVAMVNRTYAERHFPGESAIGRTVLVRGVERRIVGIVADATEFSVGAPPDPVLYLTYEQEVEPWMRAGVYVVMRSAGVGPSRAALVQASGEVDGRLPVGSPFPLTDYVDSDTVAYRFRALLATGLGLLALALASLGLAGVTAYVVRRRTRELGVRVALGAGPERIAATVLRGSGGVAALGIALGLLAAIPAGRLLAGFLYEVRPVDPLSLAVAGAALGITSVVAAAVPTKRALRITPVEALRED